MLTPHPPILILAGLVEQCRGVKPSAYNFDKCYMPNGGWHGEVSVLYSRDSVCYSGQRFHIFSFRRLRYSGQRLSTLFPFTITLLGA